MSVRICRCMCVCVCGCTCLLYRSYTYMRIVFLLCFSASLMKGIKVHFLLLSHFFSLLFLYACIFLPPSCYLSLFPSVSPQHNYLPPLSGLSVNSITSFPLTCSSLPFLPTASFPFLPPSLSSSSSSLCLSSISRWLLLLPHSLAICHFFLKFYYLVFFFF